MGRKPYRWPYCDRLAVGREVIGLVGRGLSVKKAVEAISKPIDTKTFWRWIKAIPVLEREYTRARIERDFTLRIRIAIMQEKGMKDLAYETDRIRRRMKPPQYDFQAMVNERAEAELKRRERSEAARERANKQHARRRARLEPLTPQQQADYRRTCKLLGISP